MDKSLNHRSTSKSAFSSDVQDMLDREAKRVTSIKVFFWMLALVVFYLSFQQSKVDFFKLVRNSSNMREYISGYFPPIGWIGSCIYQTRW